MKRACIFVDGENFRHSLTKLFAGDRYSFSRFDYLPRADWHKFFTLLAKRFDCELLRAYWYVVEHVDCRPYRIPGDWKEKERLLSRWYPDRVRQHLDAAHRRRVLREIESELESARRQIERRTHGWHEVQCGIENRNDQLEFRRSGSIPYELATKQFGVEKGVDVQMSTDMVLLSGIYDSAIVLSGDADYLPAVAAVKSKGKFVYGVSFLTQKGELLRGGARRLRNAVDAQVDLEFDVVRQALNIEPVVVSDSRSPAASDSSSLPARSSGP